MTKDCFACPSPRQQDNLRSSISNDTCVFVARRALVWDLTNLPPFRVVEAPQEAAQDAKTGALPLASSAATAAADPARVVITEGQYRAQAAALREEIEVGNAQLKKATDSLAQSGADLDAKVAVLEQLRSKLKVRPHRLSL